MKKVKKADGSEVLHTGFTESLCKLNVTWQGQGNKFSLGNYLYSYVKVSFFIF